MLSFRSFVLIAASIAGLSSAAPAQQTPAPSEATGMRLEDSGFKIRRVTDAPAIDRLKSLPPDRFVARIKNGKRYYLFAEPYFCKCVFVGDEAALQTYRDMPKGVGQPDTVWRDGPNPAGELIRDMDEDEFRTTFPGELMDSDF